MSEENLDILTGNSVSDLESESEDQTEFPEIEDFDQNGLLLKVAVNGITVQDYVKRFKGNGILVAVDGQLYRDGPAK